MKKLYFLAVLSALVLLYSGCVVENEEPPRPVELVISEQPTKVEYKKGDELDLSGLKVTLKKSDGTSEVLEKGKYKAVPAERTVLAEPGEKTVRITAEGLSVTFTITVTAPEEKPDVSAVGLVISKKPAKVEYKKGETLDLSGLEVTLKKSDGTSEVLAEYTAEPENGSELTRLGKQPVTITAEGLSVTFTITVTEPEEKPDVSAVGLEISKQPTKAVYKKGDELDLSGLEVTLKKSDGTSEVLTQYTTEPVNGSELTRLGKQSVTITAEGLEMAFDICVAGLEILQLPETDYTFYVPLDLSGLEVKRYNTDGTSEVLKQYATEPKNKSILAEIGKLPVTITAGELAETFEISVSDEYVVVDDNENHILMEVPDKVKEKAVNITVPESIVQIEDNVFTGCQSSSEIKLLGSVAKGFGSQAFEGFSGVVRVANGDTSFLSCISLKRVVIEKGVTTIGTEAFYGCQNLTSIDIPDSVTTIGVGAFSRCQKLTSIDIPDSVTTICEAAFLWCAGLTSIDISNSVTTIGECAFAGCQKLPSVVIPDSVTTIGDNAFDDCKNLTSVVIPDRVTTIGVGAFSRCQKLTSIDIPDSVTTIGVGAFSSCENLKSVTYGGSKEQWNKIGVYDRTGVQVGTMETELENNRVGLGLGDRTIVCTDGLIEYKEVINE